MFLFENDLANKQCADDHNLLPTNVMLKGKIKTWLHLYFGGCGPWDSVITPTSFCPPQVS